MSVLEEDKYVVDALRRVGIQVSSIYELVNSKSPYPRAIPVLLSVLPNVKNRRIKEGIIRALTVKEARGTGAAKTLIAEFRQYGNDASYSNLKWAIGNALSVVADDEVFEDIVDLVRDQKHGQAREMLALALANMKNTRAIDVLIELLNDEETAGHAIAALGKLKATKARPSLERFLNHPKAWFRKEARRALDKIDRAR